MDQLTIAGASQRPNRTTEATIAKQDSAVFNHMAVLALTDHKHSRDHIADTLGVSERTVRRYQALSCPSYEAERNEVMQREAIDGDACRFLSDAEITREEALRGSRGSTRGMVYDLMSEGLSAADIAATLGFTRKAVEYHMRGIKSFKEDL